MEQLERFRGSLLGLAVADAVGTTLEFKKPGTFTPINDLMGGGPFNLKAGQWTDDTSMALCLAESLIECRGFDPADQMRRYVDWYRSGHLSSTGRCFDIGSTVRGALEAFEISGEAFSGENHEWSAGNGSIMRLAPVPMLYVNQPQLAIKQAAASSRTTHGATAAVDACRYLAGLLVGALNGVSKAELLGERYSPLPGRWADQPLHPLIDEIAAGSFKVRQPPEIVGSGYVVKSLEAALWALHWADSFGEGCLLAANLGNDADTTAAVYGQLAGAIYGEQAIPEHWRSQLAQHELISSFAEQLHQLAQQPPQS